MPVHLPFRYASASTVSSASVHPASAPTLLDNDDIQKYSSAVILHPDPESYIAQMCMSGFELNC
jgi:hypothetical protein